MPKHILFTGNLDAALKEVEELGGRLLHRFSDSVFVAEVPEGVKAAALKHSREQLPEALDPDTRLMVDAWRATEAKARQGTKGPSEGLPWDAPGHQPPRKDADEGGGRGEERLLKAIPRRTLSGPVGIGIVIVSGTEGDWSFTSAQRTKIVQEALEATNFLVGAEPRALVSFAYDIRNLTVSAPAGSARPITDAWHGLPAGFTGGFDAAVCGRGPFAGKGYFFKGDSYIRYDWASDRVESGILRITDGWHGLPAGFTGGFDAILNGDGPFAGKCYFFKGDSYVRYNWQSDRVDPGYPKRIADNWHDLPVKFTTGTDAVLEGGGSFADKCYFFEGDSYARYDWARDRADPYCSDRDYEPCEATWRDAALGLMGFGPGMSGVEQYVQQLIRRLRVPQAFVVFFTRYPLTHFGYAHPGGPSIVIHYDNDGWGTDNLNRTLAHEACHIFWALDEYRTSGCTCEGRSDSAFKVPNRNCENCPDEHVDCIMWKNSLSLCVYTRGQLGWNYGLEKIDAAVCGQGQFSGKGYFFGGDTYVRYDWASDQADTGSRFPITDGWHGLPAGFTGGFDAAINGNGPFAGKCYFFKGDFYVRYDWASDRAESGILRITDGWHGLPAGFTGGFDAAVCGRGPFAGKGYFFKGDFYVRYDWQSDRVESGILRITDGWNGLPAGFTGGFDAAINGNGPFAGKCYFFKGDSYVRYDWQSDRVDPGYPKKIRDEWPGVLAWLPNP